MDQREQPIALCRVVEFAHWARQVGRLDLIQALAVTDDGTMLYSGGTGCVIKGWDVENAMCTKKLEVRMGVSGIDAERTRRQL